MAKNDKKYALGVDFGSSKTVCFCGYRDENGTVSIGAIERKRGSYRFDSAVYKDGICSKYFLEAFEQAATAKNPSGLRISLKENAADELEGSSEEVKAFFAEIKRQGIFAEDELFEMKLSELYDNISSIVYGYPVYFLPGKPETYFECMNEALGKDAKKVAEPVLAACAYFYYNPEEFKDGEKVLVVDLGGYTMDVALLEVVSNKEEKKTLKPIESGSYESETAIDMGKLITLGLAKKIHGKYIFDCSIEDAKCKLLSDPDLHSVKATLQYNAPDGKTSATICFYAEQNSNSVSLDGLRDLQKKIEARLNGWLKSCELGKDDISHIILTGGSSNIKVLQRKIGGMFGAEKLKLMPNKSVEGNSLCIETAVAIGACLVALDEFPDVRDYHEAENLKKKNELENADALAVLLRAITSSSAATKEEIFGNVNSEMLKKKADEASD